MCSVILACLVIWYIYAFSSSKISTGSQLAFKNNYQFSKKSLHFNSVVLSSSIEYLKSIENGNDTAKTSQSPKQNQTPATTTNEHFKNFAVLDFLCPTFHQLNNLPDNCNTREKLYPSVYKSAIYPIYPPRNPGPSEQTHGVKDVIMATVQLGKEFMLSNFTSHKTDGSKTNNIPFGARIDINKFCDLTELNHPDSVKHKTSNFFNAKLQTVIMISEKPSKLGWEKMQLVNYLKSYSELKFPDDKTIMKNITLPQVNYASFPVTDKVTSHIFVRLHHMADCKN